MSTQESTRIQTSLEYLKYLIKDNDYFSKNALCIKRKLYLEKLLHISDDEYFTFLYLDEVRFYNKIIHKITKYMNAKDERIMSHNAYFVNFTCSKIENFLHLLKLARIQSRMQLKPCKKYD